MTFCMLHDIFIYTLHTALLILYFISTESCFKNACFLCLNVRTHHQHHTSLGCLLLPLVALIDYIHIVQNTNPLGSSKTASGRLPGERGRKPAHEDLHRLDTAEHCRELSAAARGEESVVQVRSLQKPHSSPPSQSVPRSQQRTHRNAHTNTRSGCYLHESSA